jgi:hypothetical protein
LPGKLWSIEKNYQIHQNVTENGMPATSENIKGCTDKAYLILFLFAILFYQSYI